MDKIMSDFTGVLLAIVGVAIIGLLVSKNSNTSSVVKSVFGGFSQALGTAEQYSPGSYITAG